MSYMKYTLICLCIAAFLTHGYAEKISAAQKKGSGIIDIISTPPDAQVIINGIETGLITPATLTNLKPGIYTVEISLPDYLFSKRQVTVTPDTAILLSFELISLSDTAHIIGDLKLGILYLPQTPIDNPYLVDNKQIYAQEVTLNTGKHSVGWEGGNVYSSLDTIIEIYPGKLTTFQFSPQRLYGSLVVSASPADAEIYINNRQYATGTLNLALATGTYSISVRHEGYYPDEQQVIILPDKQTSVSSALRQIPDRDRDGFLDSLDICPDEYGLYEGCPQQKKAEAIKRSFRSLWDNLRQQPFTFSISLLGYLNRVPTNRQFSEILSYFNDGRAFFNNKKGFTFGNTYAVSFYGFFLALELGQWNSGLEYKKEPFNPLLIHAAKDTYCIYYDTLADIRPTVTLPSTALSLGISVTIKKIRIAYGMGYQWENIRIYDLITQSNLKKYQNGMLIDSSTMEYIGPRTTVVFENRWWFHMLNVQWDLYRAKRSVLAAYASAFLSFGTGVKTGWRGIQAGVLYKFIPHDAAANKKKKTTVSFTR